MKSPLIALLSDFGTKDSYVASMKGVILSKSPRATIIDVLHEVNPNEVTGPDFLLWRSYRFFPPGTIFVCVVDPGVGTSRAILCVRRESFYFLAPDNGLLKYVFAAPGGPGQRVIEVRPGKKASATFHGRDVFAPAAAHLANGRKMSELGERVLPRFGKEHFARIPSAGRGPVSCEVIHIDHFGNIVTNVRYSGENFRRWKIRVGRGVVKRHVRTYGEGGQEPFALEGSTGLAEISVKEGNAAECLKARLHQELILFR